MANSIEPSSKDWANNIHIFSRAWGLPLLVMIAGAFLEAPIRSVIWSAALVWMGAACLINFRRCGRTHCRFTGPFYLILVIPVILLGYEQMSFGPYGWCSGGASCGFMSKIICWATEALWGKYSTPQ